MSQDLGKSLLAKADILIENWIEAIREDEAIDSSRGLSDRAIRDHTSDVLEAIATMLSQSVEDRTQKLKDRSWSHGIVRAEQNYDIAEIVREYSILRKIIFTALKPDLQNDSGAEILQTVELIDSAIDCVITLSIESYVETRLKELEQVRGQLLLTNQELTRLVATQKEDISHMAHELKSPLNAIMGFSSLLLQQQQKASKGQETTLSLQMTEKVINNGRQLLRLINDILEISRYDAGKVTPNIQSSDVRSLIITVTETLEITANQKNVALILNCDRAPQQIQTDPLKLQQIVTNLIGNAIRYTESGTIAITCQTNKNNSWSLIVADTGIGMSPEAQAKVFEPYYRVSRGNFSEDGTGLGLAIVDKLVKLLQGEIALTSKLGEGSIFTVTFPLNDK